MRHICIYIIYMCICCIANAQIQQGIVKTPTRRNANGTITKGQYIANATVGIFFSKNNSKQSYVSGAGGAFSFSATSPYFVTSVTANKGTYTFLDADFSKKQRTYSTNAVEVLVDDPDVLAKVREEAVAHERNKIRKQIRAKEDEIDALKEANKITTAEYNKMLGELSEYRQSSEAIVQQIAEVYATTDFDKLDEFNKQLLAFVEEGDFARADSLLKTQNSKEELFKKIKDTDEAIKITEEHTQKAKELNNKEKEALSQRLYSEHLMWLQKPLMQDSALYCLKMRADLDTTNVDAVREYAQLCYRQKKFSECESYYMICLRLYEHENDLRCIMAIQDGLGTLYCDIRDYKSSEVYYKSALESYEYLEKQGANPDISFLAIIQNNLGNLYCDIHDYENSEKYYKLALENNENLFYQNSEANRENLSMVQNNIGTLYSKIHDYENSEKYYKLSLEHTEYLFAQNPDVYRSYLAMSQNNLGNLYRDIRNYESSEMYYKLALENKKHLFNQNPDAYRFDIAMTQNNLGNLYCDIFSYENSEIHYKSALENYEYLFIISPDAYRPNIAMVQFNLGNLYCNIQNYESSEQYYKLALDNYQYLFTQYPDTYRATLANVQNNLANLYNNLHDYTNSEKYYKLSLENREILIEQNPEVYRVDYAMTLNNLGSMYCDIEDYANGEKCYKMSLENYELLLLQKQDSYCEKLAMVQYNLGNLYQSIHEFGNCEKYYLLAMGNYEPLFETYPDVYRKDLASIQHNIGKLYYSLHDYARSEKYLYLALENRELLYSQNQDAYRRYLGRTYWSIMLLYAAMEEFDKYDISLNKTLVLCRELYNTQPSIYKDDVIELQNRKIYRMLFKGNVNDALEMAKETYAMDESNEQSKELLAECYNGKAYSYANNNLYVEAFESIDKALSLTSINATFYDSKGEFYLMQGKNQEALEMWKKVLELNPNFLDDFPDGTNLSNGLKKLGLIK